jgi:hypothetical protein
MRQLSDGERTFRLWIATCAQWRPQRWTDLPPRATALEPVDDAVYSAAEAALFLQGFNASMLDGSGPVWAVAVPVVICYEGDAVAGADVRGFDFRELAALAPEPSW